MPIAEEDLTEEQKRQALLEDLYGEESRLPQSAIPADNVSFTNGADGRIQVDVPEGYAPPVERPMIGDEQYQNELARAQRGNGFIAAEVSNNGELLQPAIDPNYRSPAQLVLEGKIATAAKRFKGQQMYASLIKGGASPAEAIRLAGADLFAANPTGMVNAVLRSQPKPALPTTITPQALRDENGNIIAHGVIGPSGGVQIIRPKAEAKAVMPEDVAASQKLTFSKLADARKDLERARKELDQLDPNATGESSKAEYQAAARRAMSYKNNLDALEQQYQQGSTNWMGSKVQSPSKVSEQLQRPTVTAPNGQKMTVKTIGVGDERGEWVIPTIVDGKEVSEKEAIRLWKAGSNPALNNVPFKTPEEGTKWAQELHRAEETRISRPKVSEKQSDPKKANEVQRVTKDGRLAIFDANTRSFLRYAD